MQNSLGVGKDPEASPEFLFLWHWSTLQRLLSYCWPRKLFSTVPYSAQDLVVLFLSNPDKLWLQGTVNAMVPGCIVSLLYFLFFSRATSFSAQGKRNTYVTTARSPIAWPSFLICSVVELFLTLLIKALFYVLFLRLCRFIPLH